MKTIDIPDASARIRMAYLEMPEMRLTRGQLQRLLDLSSDDCERALLTLTESGFLIESWDGAFVRSINPSLRGRAAHILDGRRRESA